MSDGQQGMYVLGLDTCGAEASLALVCLQSSGMELIGETVLRERTAGSLLTGALRDLLAAAEIPPAGLGAIVVVRGPGSFTGMRIGLSAAKALSEVAGVPLVAVSRLAVLAAVSGAGLVALDAGRDNVYVRVASEADSQGLAQEDAGYDVYVPTSSDGEDASERLLTPSEFESLQPGPGGLAVCESKLHARYPNARFCAAPTAVDAIRWAFPRITAGDWDDTATLDALYLWRAEQMLRRPEGRYVTTR